MKKLSAIMSVLMLMSFINPVTAGGPEDGITADNYLKLKTHLIDEDLVVDVLVFTYDTHANEWIEVKRKAHKKNHTIRLNPRYNHQLWFVDEMGTTKILYIDKGESGPWMKIVDLDFKDNIYHAKLTQNIIAYEYELSIVNSDYDTLMVDGALEDIKTYKTKACSAVMMR